jgi:hypothetical protein
MLCQQLTHRMSLMDVTDNVHWKRSVKPEAMMRVLTMCHYSILVHIAEAGQFSKNAVA